jgi:hypothetical protein
MFRCHFNFFFLLLRRYSSRRKIRKFFRNNKIFRDIISSNPTFFGNLAPQKVKYGRKTGFDTDTTADDAALTVAGALRACS